MNSFNKNEENSNTKKYILLFLLLCIPISNLLWYIGYSFHVKNEESTEAMSIIVLTSFLPALTALVLCKINKEGWEGLKVLPNLRRSWRVYILAVVLTWIMIYLNDPLLLLIFHGDVTYLADGTSLAGWGRVFGLTLLAFVSSIEMLGEELGWLGFLFPKLEKLYGTRMAIVLLSIARTVWHFGILAFMPHPVAGGVDLFFSNLLTQSFLIYLTKKSDSLFPAAVVHAMANLLPVFIVYSDGFYDNHVVAVNFVGSFSSVVVGGLCYCMMKRENMIHS